MARSRRFEDDDEEDDRPARRSRRDEPAPGGNTAVKVIGIIGGVLVVLFLVCGGLAYYVFWSTKKAVNEVGQDMAKRADKMQEETRLQADKMAEENRLRQKELENSDKQVSLRAAEAFVQELRGRRTDAAYDLTTVAYQQRVTREEFAELLERFKDELGTGVPLSADIFAPEKGPSFSYKKTLLKPVGRGFLEMLVTMVKVGTSWKVDQFTIEPKR